MPVRNMLYDSLTYTTQIQRLHKANNNEENVKVTRDEFLSKFRKDDKIFVSDELPTVPILHNHMR